MKHFNWGQKITLTDIQGCESKENRGENRTDLPVRFLLQNMYCRAEGSVLDPIRSSSGVGAYAGAARRHIHIETVLSRPRKCLVPICWIYAQLQPTDLSNKDSEVIGSAVCSGEIPSWLTCCSIQWYNLEEESWQCVSPLSQWRIKSCGSMNMWWITVEHNIATKHVPTCLQNKCKNGVFALKKRIFIHLSKFALRIVWKLWQYWNCFRMKLRIFLKDEEANSIPSKGGGRGRDCDQAPELCIGRLSYKNCWIFYHLLLSSTVTLHLTLPFCWTIKCDRHVGI